MSFRHLRHSCSKRGQRPTDTAILTRAIGVFHRPYNYGAAG